MNLFENNTIKEKVDLIQIGLNLPEEYQKDLILTGSTLESLKGSPKTIFGKFDVSGNYLTSLEYGPEIVTSDYKCGFNDLISLEGAPKKVNSFECNNNENLRSLVNGPEIVIHGLYCCSHTGIENLIGASTEVNGAFLANNNVNLTSLKGVSKKIKGGLILRNCPNLTPWEMRYVLFSKVGGVIMSDISSVDILINKFLKLSPEEKQEKVHDAMAELKAM